MLQPVKQTKPDRFFCTRCRRRSRTARARLKVRYSGHCDTFEQAIALQKRFSSGLIFCLIFGLASMAQNCLSRAGRSVLVCFALRQEAAAFKRVVRANPAVTTVVTGMGLTNTGLAVQRVMHGRHFDEVFSCGFAGGLNPRLVPGTVLFDTTEPALAERLQKAGAIPARFVLVHELLVTAAAKAHCYSATGADAAQCESDAVQAICRARNTPFAVVRVVLDAADEDLPIDFNKFIAVVGGFQYSKFFGTIARDPAKIRLLIPLVKRCQVARAKLAAVLAAAICQ